MTDAEKQTAYEAHRAVWRAYVRRILAAPKPPTEQQDASAGVVVGVTV